MEQVERLIDTDPASLEERVSRLVARIGEACVVRRFTHWFTGRPPMHEALVLRDR